MSRECDECKGAGYVLAELTPKKEQNGWFVQIHIPACRKCQGSGLDLATASVTEIASRRVLNRALARERARQLHVQLKTKLGDGGRGASS